MILNHKSRTKNSIINSGTILFVQIVTVCLNFVTRTIFIKYLDISLLGINGLFSNILTVLSFAELGFGAAISFELYKPLANNNEFQVAAIMNFFSQIYKKIALIIFGVGILLIPALDYFIEDSSQIPLEIPPLWFIYLLFLINTSISYLFNYKRTLLIASQNAKTDAINNLLVSVVKNFIQIIVIAGLRSYVGYLLVQIICTIGGNILISIKTDRIYPFLKTKYNGEKLSYEIRHNILKNVVAMAMHRLGGIIVDGTDNVLIAKFVGITITGYYSNYILITGTIRTLCTKVFSSITSSVGNFIVDNNKVNSYIIFRRLMFINFIVALFTTTLLSSLINPFIALLWGEEYLLGKYIVSFIILNFFLTCMRQVCWIYIDASGLFWQLRWKSLIEGIVNLVASIYLSKKLKLGLFGVVAGTTISTITTNLWWEPYIVYKFGFTKPVNDYFKIFAIYSFATLVSVSSCLFLEKDLHGGIIMFLYRIFISFIIPCFITCCFFMTDEFKYLKMVTMTLIKKVLCSDR